MSGCCYKYKKNNITQKKCKNQNIKLFTRKKNKIMKCVAKIFSNKKIKNNKVKGIVLFEQIKDSLVIKYNIKNLNDGEHGFHVHRCGDITNDCDSGCEHFNPFNKNHGSLNSEDSHAGDLGNIISKNNKAKGKIVTKKISIIPSYKNSIIGRMIIVHKDRDDLGLGGDSESLKTGNAGKRMACGIIGIKENI